MKKILKSIIIFMFFILFAGISNAGPSEWKIDNAHSGIYFDVTHIFSTVRGKFDDFSGKILVDTDKPDNSSVEFSVEVKSINTGINQRDTHLRTADFFDVKDYPYMKFKSTEVKHVDENRYLLKGMFTIKDVTREIEIPFVYLGKKDNPSNKGEWVSGFEADFSINRLDYNVGNGKFYDMGLVDKDVRILITLELIKKK